MEIGSFCELLTVIRFLFILPASTLILYLRTRSYLYNSILFLHILSYILYAPISLALPYTSTELNVFFLVVGRPYPYSLALHSVSFGKF